MAERSLRNFPPLALSLSLLQHRLERGTDAPPPPARVRALVVSGLVLLLHDSLSPSLSLSLSLSPHAESSDYLRPGYS